MFIFVKQTLQASVFLSTSEHDKPLPCEEFEFKVFVYATARLDACLAAGLNPR